MLRFFVIVCLFVCFQSASYGAQGDTKSIATEFNYDIEPCCNLCSAALDPDSYDTRKLSGMRFLKDGKNGWLFRSDDDFMTAFGPDPDNVKQLSRFIKMLNQRGTEVAILYIPTRGMIHADELISPKSVDYNLWLAQQSYSVALSTLRETGAIVPNMALAFKGLEDDDFFFKRDHHWTPAGARYSAEVLANEIKQQPIYKVLKKSNFRTHETNLMRRAGQLQIAAKRICDFDYPYQYVKNYETEPELDDVTTGSTDDLLFGDNALPEVVLVGTSNSWNGKNDFNFSGFLKEYLGVDVLNESIAGGNFDGSILQYLLSDEYKDSPPKLLVWEMPSYYDLNDPMFYRRVRPMVSGGCDQREVVLQTATKLTSGKNEILFNGGGEVKRLKSKDLIVDLQFDNPEFRELVAYSWYVHGRREPIRMKVTNRVDIQGRFVFEMMPDDEWKDFLYLSMDVILPELTTESQASMPTSVTAKICIKDY